MNNSLTIRAFNERFAVLLPVRAIWVLLALVAAIAIVVIWSLMTGSYPLTVTQVIEILRNAPEGETGTTIVWEFRFPRAVVSVMVGALLALSGATLQNVTRNPLADPSLVGVSQGGELCGRLFDHFDARNRLLLSAALRFWRRACRRRPHPMDFRT